MHTLHPTRFQTHILYLIFIISVVVYFVLTKEFVILTLTQDTSDRIIPMYMGAISAVWVLSIIFNWLQLTKHLKSESLFVNFCTAIFPMAIIPLVIAVLFSLHWVENLF